ncbi:MAG: DEAD/DEAH box helicase [Candidatus Anammoxibacter sp.]
MGNELNIIAMPDCSIQMEWSETNDVVIKSQMLLQEEIFKRYHSDPFSSLLFLGFSDKTVPLSVSLGYWRDFSGLFARKLSLTPDLETIRHKVDILPDDEELHTMLDKTPIMIGAEYLNKELLTQLWLKLKETFSKNVRSFKGSVEDFIKTFSPNIHLVGRVFFHLVENKNNDFPFAFLATYSTGLDKKGASKHLPLKAALEEYGKEGEKLLKLLTAVHLAAKDSVMINNLLTSGELFQPLAWTTDEAYTFLKETPLYENAGVLCRIPNWWKGNSTTIAVNINIGTKPPSFVGMDAILDFNPQLMVGDSAISLNEAKKFLSESEGLVFIKNKWVAVDPEKLKQTIDVYKKALKLAEKEGLSLKEAMRLYLNPNRVLNIGDEINAVSVSNGKWFESVLVKLRNPDLISSTKTDHQFKAKLRHYQQKGLDWLAFLHSLGFGACLADDMGLGKTVQLLAFLNVLKAQKVKNHKASLLIIPASLISNWADEIAKFFVNLKYCIAHPSAGSDKKINATDKKSLDRYDLVITTYALSQKYKWLSDYSWNYVILDEAQAIKNPGTKQTKAVKQLEANNRIAMTGTPVENKLSDLWSLFDFLNPGLLGSAKEFTAFSKGLNDHPDGHSRLRKLISPYILRRLKTDKTVISDLPDKIEIKTYTHLTKKQIVLYDSYVQELNRILDNTTGIQRKGVVLASIMKFKQLCNHPAQYLGNGDYNENDSGKFGRLREICETIAAKREKVLIFTQFKEITEHLAEFLTGVFGRAGLVLHGSTPVAKRKKIIDKFRSIDYVPFMVLSLKAGGVGLNLTQANHVIHFDRWWNPAVENQATDRVFRIGQKKNVMVHKFLTKGTLEEKIDMMLEEKTKLSHDVLQSSGETMITEMDNNQLIKLFSRTL